MNASTLFCGLGLCLLAQGVHGADTLRPLDEAALRATALPSSTRVATPAQRSVSSRMRLAERLGLAAPTDVGNDTGTTLRLLGHPLFGLLNADLSARDVVYAPGTGMPSVAADGAIVLALPQSVGQLNLQNIRTGANDSSNFGSIQIRALDLSRTVITVSPTR